MTAYLRPSVLDEALVARAEHPDYMVLCGGTDLLVDAPKKPVPKGIIDLFGMRELVGVRRASDGALRLGAATTYSQLLRDPGVTRELPALAAAMREIGALQIQARGTIGGNIATSSPVGDTLPVLLALDATIELAGASGTRRVPYREFCTGYRKTQLGANELIVAVEFPADVGSGRQMWRKVGPRRAQSISKVMMAGFASGNTVRIALGAVADRPIRVEKTEAVVARRGSAAEIRKTLASEIKPIDDVRSTAQYRLRVAQNLVCAFAETRN